MASIRGQIAFMKTDLKFMMPDRNFSLFFFVFLSLQFPSISLCREILHKPVHTQSVFQLRRKCVTIKGNFFTDRIV
jgi:hypothetical protein